MHLNFYLEDAQLLGILVKRFQLQCFKDYQLKTIGCPQGKDTFVNQPTGPGKSLTFQFPPLGVCVCKMHYFGKF